MNPLAIQYAVQVMAALPGMIEAGVNVVALINRARERVETMQAEKRAPTPEEWAELNEQIVSLRSELHAGTANTKKVVPD